MPIFKKKEKPVNINDLANRHLVTSLNAMHQEDIELQKGTVAGRHMPYIKLKHLAIVESLDAMLEANERTNNA